MPPSGPTPGTGSSTASTPAGSGGSAWPAACTTTPAPSTLLSTTLQTCASSDVPPQGSAAFGLPIRRDRPPARITPAVRTGSGARARPVGEAQEAPLREPGRAEVGDIDRRCPAGHLGRPHLPHRRGQLEPVAAP